MVHPALTSTAHRPWPVPNRAWSLTMRWEELLFAHWPVDAEQLRAHIPQQLTLDTFDGQAWLGVVPFVMASTRFRWTPPMPTAHRFAECNLRTYVRDDAGRTGVWFFSLDAASRLAVEGARLGFGLPYFRATMDCRREGDTVHYRSERRDRRAPPARFEGRWDTSGPFRGALPGLEQFLVERYCLFARRRGAVVCGEVAHPPWRVAPTTLEIDALDMTQLVGMPLVGAPASVLAAQAIDVAAWSPRKIQAGP